MHFIGSIPFSKVPARYLIKMRYFIWIVLVILIFVRYFTTRPVFKTGDKIRITSTIYSDPIKYPGSQYLRIASLKTYLPSAPEIYYGNRVVVEGVVNGDKLDSPKLISVVENSSPLSGVRKSIISFYNSALPEPESGLLAGIVLGSRSSLSQDLYNRTKLVGVAHIVVASGTNVTFVVGFLTSILFVFLPRRKSIPFVILGIVLYLFISGFDAPLIRAAIMSLAIFVSQVTGRIISGWRVFFLTVGIMLTYNPEWVVDVGFLLSFASTGAIMLLSQKVNVLLRRVPEFVREDLATTLSAQVGTTPILFVIFKQFNILSPVVNLLVLWVVPFLMIIGSVGGLIGLALPSLGKIIVLLGYPMLWWFVKVIEVFS